LRRVDGEATDEQEDQGIFSESLGYEEVSFRRKLEHGVVDLAAIVWCYCTSRKGNVRDLCTLSPKWPSKEAQPTNI